MLIQSNFVTYIFFFLFSNHRLAVPVSGPHPGGVSLLQEGVVGRDAVCCRVCWNQPRQRQNRLCQQHAAVAVAGGHVDWPVVAVRPVSQRLRPGGGDCGGRHIRHTAACVQRSLQVSWGRCYRCNTTRNLMVSMPKLVHVSKLKLMEIYVQDVYVGNWCSVTCIICITLSVIIELHKITFETSVLVDYHPPVRQHSVITLYIVTNRFQRQSSKVSGLYFHS